MTLTDKHARTQTYTHTQPPIQKKKLINLHLEIACCEQTNKQRQQQALLSSTTLC